ncbi:hypothetical protein RF55_13541 [Lasius niger]|uniref:Uncharacterized protein n=1 Tax=Lasius niger TaxID=67767 RepID=A0A0J7KAH9_LASNI|nr:hypothetical protein RF55_13558 [Lasius niger]KMQ87236.1 hypothetical protein RF55_13541 [Lasius niger]
MLKAKQEIKRIARMDIEKFVKDVKDVQNNSKMDKTKKNPLDSNKEGGGQRLRRKRSLVSEKGMRHISRLMRLISGKQPLDNVVGLVKIQPMKILFDHRGEFNVVTEAAIKQIESKVGRLERLKDSEYSSIPEKRKEN